MRLTFSGSRGYTPSFLPAPVDTQYHFARGCLVLTWYEEDSRMNFTSLGSTPASVLVGEILILWVCEGNMKLYPASNRIASRHIRTPYQEQKRYKWFTPVEKTVESQRTGE